DDPAVMRIAPLDDAGFLEDEAEARPRLAEFLAQYLLRPVVGGGDEIGRPLARDLQLLDLAEVALQPARCLVGGAGHDVDDGGACRHVASWRMERAGPGGEPAGTQSLARST